MVKAQKRSFRSMPACIFSFFQAAKSPACMVQTCPLRLKFANCDRGPGTEEMFLSYVSYCQN
jgi:hypothetical protein